MALRILLMAALVAATGLAGCVDQPTADSDDDSDQALQDEPQAHRVQLAERTHVAVDRFTGTFAFEDNNQFVGQVEEAVGQDSDVRTHDLSHLLPDDGIFSLRITAEADPAGGDIDAWVTGPALVMSTCDCAFGGFNQIHAVGRGGDSLQVHIQYDEISSGPTEPEFALQGFDYTIDVDVIADLYAIPSGVPLALQLQGGDVVDVASHTESITVYGPDDVQVHVLEPTARSWTLPAEAPDGEYVMIGRADGARFEVTVTRLGEAPSVRVLDAAFDIATESYDPGQPAVLEFNVPPTAVKVRACGNAKDATVQPEITVYTPDGSAWGSFGDAFAFPIGGWGACFDNWRGSPNQMPGIWSIQLTETAGDGASLSGMTWSYVR